MRKFLVKMVLFKPIYIECKKRNTENKMKIWEVNCMRGMLVRGKSPLNKASLFPKSEDTVGAVCVQVPQERPREQESDSLLLWDKPKTTTTTAGKEAESWEWIEPKNCLVQ